jgi:hypothetical protein
MNKYEHADSSVTIFGGKPEQYLEIHELIDSNKVVTPSIFGRFFLHHFDVGLVILEAIFGKNTKNKKVPVRHVFIQHLLEDYGRLVTFENHWVPAMDDLKRHQPQPEAWGDFLNKTKLDPRLKGVKEKHLTELETFFNLTHFGFKENYAIFGHALGGDLLCKIIGKKFHGQFTSDIITGYLNCRFKNVDEHKDNVPTLLDWEKCVPDKEWMHRPKTPVTVEFIKSQIERDSFSESLKNNSNSLIKKIKSKIVKPEMNSSALIIHKQPCNLD